MSISLREENGQQVIIIKDQPQLTENTLGALIELVDGLDGHTYMIQRYLDNLEATALIAGEDRHKWEEEFMLMQFLRDFLIRIRRHEDPNQSL